MYAIRIISDGGMHRVCIYQVHENTPIALQSTYYANTDLAAVEAQSRTLQQSYAGRLKALCPNDHLVELGTTKCPACKGKVRA